MGRKFYKGPIIRELGDGGQGEIVIGASQGTSGYDSPYTFVGISDEDLDMIDLNCDDIDLDEMDANDDQVITFEEFDAWLTARGGW